MKGRKRDKYAAELAKIKEFRALDTILKKGDIENALLTNTAKESEPVSENVIDSILNSVNKGKVGERDLELIEKLTTKTKRTTKAPGTKKAGHKAKRAVKARRILRIFKRKRSKAKKRRR